MISADAKQFLISPVIEEAKVEDIHLSEIEQKMLYFTEVHPTIPDIYEVNTEFERNYDSDEYESKIASLLRNARERDKNQSPNKEQLWKDALDALRKEDHYILVMVAQAFGSSSASFANNKHRVRDFLIYIAIGLAFVIILVVYAAYRS